MAEVLAGSSKVRATATETLRRMLDELQNLASDVNEAEIRSHSVINLIQGPYNRRFVLDMNHDWLNAWHAEFERILQAIAATLGAREQPPYDELIEALRRDWDIEASWDGLRRFWYVGLTDEGVRKRDEREATLGRGTCRNKSKWTNVFNCSACGFEYDFVTDPYQGPRYCPNCGRRIVEVTE